MDHKHLKIWIDTGGTFTDCIIQKRDGPLHYLKVLSDGTLRARVGKIIHSKCLEIEHHWPLEKDILSGYSILGERREEIAIIQSFDLQQNQLLLDREIPKYPGDSLVLSAREEAPLLAIRMAMNIGIKEEIQNSMIHLGTTKGTNALLERKGAKVCLLCTKGFKDLSLIGTQQRPNIFSMNIPFPAPLFSSVIELDEQVNAKGYVKKDLDIVNLIHRIPDDSEAIAIAFKNSYINGSNEIRAKKTLQNDLNIPLSVSSELDPEIKLLNRTQSTLINAYLSPTIEKYLDRISSKMQQSQLNIMSSTGTLLHRSIFKPMDSLLSGPAGGLKGAVYMGKRIGRKKVISFDMGGTSTDVSRFNGSFDFQYETKIAEFETNLTSLNIGTVAAGGGSICYYEDGLLKVGPQSAGAFPGPASYGQGGPLCLTDVNILLGKMYTDSFHFPLDIQAAEKALRKIVQQSGLDRKTVLSGFERIANQVMANAIKRISIQNGFDPAEYTLVSFGGAGGMHSCRIAEELNIKEIIFPYESGLLSAYGIGQSKIEKIYKTRLTVEISQDKSLEFAFKDLIEKAKIELKQEAGLSGNIEVKQKWLNVRIKGQQGFIDLPWTEKTNILEAFNEKYYDLFGFLPENEKLEIGSIFIRIGERDGILQNQAKNRSASARIIEGKKLKSVDWDTLTTGDQINGPIVIYNHFGTVFLEQNWQGKLKENREILAQFKGTSGLEESRNEQVQLALFSNRFQHIADEMGIQLRKTAKSVNVRERLDFSCGILNKDAFLVANAPHIPVHLGSLGICGRLILEKIPCGKGDIIICNHPKYGGSHLPDISLLMAVFDKNGNKIAYLINRCHHAEIGGISPGSMPPGARTLEEEGVVFLPQYLAKEGKFNWSAIRKQLSSDPFPSRAVEDNIADLKAAIASLKAGERAFHQLLREYSSDKIQFFMDRLLDNSSGIISKALEHYSNHELRVEEQMDDGRKIQLRIRKEGTKWLFDFSGTDAVHEGNLNANTSIVHSAIVYVLRLIADRDIPLNEGLMRDIKIHLPKSFLHPDFEDDPKKCPAVVGGNTEVSQRLVDTLIKAFGLGACSQGTMNNLLFGNESFSYYETIGGGVGATKKQAGRSGIHQHMTNTRITDPEDLEKNFPVVLKEFSIRKHSGGLGKNNGGDGIVREIQFEEPVVLTILGQHRNVKPFGIVGGAPGKSAVQYLIKKNGDCIKLKASDQVKADPGDRIRIETPGGGAFGKRQ